MTRRTGLLLTCAVGALMIGAALPSRALAADKAVLAAPATDTWWWSGEAEVGGRFFLNNPQRGGIYWQGGNSLAKYYEYSSIKPGPFGDFFVQAGTKDGVYQVNTWGTNPGYTDQNFVADLSKAGEHYLTFMWDETPHVYSTSAQTLYNGVGGNALTLPAGLSNQLFTAAGCSQNPGHPPTSVLGGCLSPLDAGHATGVGGVQSIINGNVHQTDIGIRRDTAAADYRWTPTDAWDFRANYMNMRRTGTQVEGVVFSPGTSGVAAQVPKPVADTTQNFGASGEYNGISPWNQKFNLKVAYNGSIYKDDWDSYTVENPFCPTGAGPGECARTGSNPSANSSPSSPLARMSLWPDNQANGFTGTLGADLPMKSRYMGTMSYVMMRQNQPFVPTISPSVYNGACCTSNPTGAPFGSMGPPPALPANSLDGQINTFLSNNVLTTQITPDLKSKIGYRYFDFNNGTPELRFSDWVVTDVVKAGSITPQYAPVGSLSISYIKQNGVAALDWRPTRAWNVGAEYDYERYNWWRADADVTNEHSGKAFVDYKPYGWFTARASWLYGVRRYDNYDYVGRVANWQWPTVASNYNPVVGGSTRYAGVFRQFYLNDRERNKGNFQVMVDVAPGLTITPSLTLQYDNYTIDPTSQLGLNYDRSFHAGAEAAWVATPTLNFLFSYMREWYSKGLASGPWQYPAAPNGSTPQTFTGITDAVDTFTAGTKYIAVPDKLEFGVNYVVSFAVDHQPINPPSSSATFVQYPDVRTTFQRLEALAKYKVDEDIVRRMGWTGSMYVKARYAWERNAVSNWQNDMMQTYMYAVSNSTGYQTWMAYDNPNYNVHLFGASVAWTW